MDKIFLAKLYESHKSCTSCPSPIEVEQLFTKLLGALFPDFAHESFNTLTSFENHFDSLQNELQKMIHEIPNKKSNASEATVRFFNALPKIHQQLEQDVVAMYEGDPAAKSKSEVVRTYPGFYAIAAYRLAHELH